MGSLPRIESPSEIQQLTKQSSVEQGAVLASTLDIKNRILDVPDATIKNNRIEFSLQFFLNLGYSYIQAKGITENLSLKGMISGFRGEKESGSFGIAEWSGERFKNLKAFSENFKLFTTQLEFIAFELNGTQRSANIRLLQTDRYNGKKGSLYIFAKYYLKLDLLQLEQLESKGNYSE